MLLVLAFAKLCFLTLAAWASLHYLRKGLVYLMFYTIHGNDVILKARLVFKCLHACMEACGSAFVFLCAQISADVFDVGMKIHTAVIEGYYCHLLSHKRQSSLRFYRASQHECTNQLLIHY